MKKRVTTDLTENEDLLNNLMANAPKEHLQFVDRSTEVTEQIWQLMKQKGWNQKDLATAMNKSEAEVSRWLSGSHNFTLRTLAHVETVLGENIFYTAVGKDAEHPKHEGWNFYASINHRPTSEVGNESKVQATKKHPTAIAA